MWLCHASCNTVSLPERRCLPFLIGCAPRLVSPSAQEARQWTRAALEWRIADLARSGSDRTLPLPSGAPASSSWCVARGHLESTRSSLIMLPKSQPFRRRDWSARWSCRRRPATVELVPNLSNSHHMPVEPTPDLVNSEPKLGQHRAESSQNRPNVAASKSWPNWSASANIGPNSAKSGAMSTPDVGRTPDLGGDLAALGSRPRKHPQRQARSQKHRIWCQPLLALSFEKPLRRHRRTPLCGSRRRRQRVHRRGGASRWRHDGPRRHRPSTGVFPGEHAVITGTDGLQGATGKVAARSPRPATSRQGLGPQAPARERERE